MNNCRNFVKENIMKEKNKIMELKLEDSIEITITDIKLVIKHNDVGYSIDTYFKGTLIRDEQVFCDDIG